MKLSEWFAQKEGRMSAMADYFGITVSAVCQWQVNGVPASKMREVRELTQHEVTFEDMVPPVRKREAA
jgi:DNA-binding transcriptional regulator YdaS (Cro superfamily)